MAPRAIPRHELFDAEFLNSIRHLRFVARRVPRGGRWAEQRSSDLGSGLEFKDFRPYSPGDDFRSIDWNIFQRLGRVFVRLFEELEDLPLYVMVDTSDSGFLENPPRAKAGLRTALALSAISLNQHDSVGLFPFARDLTVLARPQAGKNRVLAFADRLASIEPGGPTDLVKSLRSLRAMKLRSGVVAIVSDFFDPSGIDEIVAEMRRLRHRLVLIQLTRPSDRSPDAQGDLRVVDCETGVAEDVSVTAHVLERYREAYDRFQETLAEFARSRGAGLVRLDVEQDIVTQLATLFETGSYTV